MKFRNSDHETNYEKYIQKCSWQDSEHKALIYLLTMAPSILAHIESVYDFASGCVEPECINEGWQTGGSRRITRLAFNLYNGGQPTAWLLKEEARNEEAMEEMAHYTPAELFSYSSEINEYLFEAIRICFHYA